MADPLHPVVRLVQTAMGPYGAEMYPLTAEGAVAASGGEPFVLLPTSVVKQWHGLATDKCLNDVPQPVVVQDFSFEADKLKKKLEAALLTFAKALIFHCCLTVCIFD